MKRILRHIPSLLLAMCFVVSGWLKGKDLDGIFLKLLRRITVWRCSCFLSYEENNCRQK